MEIQYDEVRYGTIKMVRSKANIAACRSLVTSFGLE